MERPRLTFFCELEPDPLEALFQHGLIDDLLEMKACLSLGILDLSQERAEVVRRLNQAGVPVTAWLLLPKDQGYWLNPDNYVQAAERYDAFRAWSDKFGLVWDGIGLDFEPDIHEMELLAGDRWRLLPRLVRHAFNRGRLKAARLAYQELVERMHADGYPVESYQIFLIADDRQVHSTLLQRLMSMVDVKVDKEVWMLYTSFFRHSVGSEGIPLGLGVLWNYAPEAQAIGLGSTGGGVDLTHGDLQPLTWDELSRDLRLAWSWTDNLYIFSLEGCVRQGFLPGLKDFVWDQPVLPPEQGSAWVAGWRHTLGTLLWISANMTAILLSLAGVSVILLQLRRMLKRRSR